MSKKVLKKVEKDPKKVKKNVKKVLKKIQKSAKKCPKKRQTKVQKSAKKVPKKCWGPPRTPMPAENLPRCSVLKPNGGEQHPTKLPQGVLDGATTSGAAAGVAAAASPWHLRGPSVPSPRVVTQPFEREPCLEMGRPTRTKANQETVEPSRRTIFGIFCQSWAAHFQTVLALEGLPPKAKRAKDSDGRCFFPPRRQKTHQHSTAQLAPTAISDTGRIETQLQLVLQPALAPAQHRNLKQDYRKKTVARPSKTWQKIKQNANWRLAPTQQAALPATA